MTTIPDELNSYKKYRIRDSANGSTPAGGNFWLNLNQDFGLVEP